MNIEHVRTPQEILRDAAAIVDTGDLNSHATVTAAQRVERNLTTHLEKRLAIEVAAGELAAALLRRRMRELERATSSGTSRRSVLSDCPASPAPPPAL